MHQTCFLLPHGLMVLWGITAVWGMSFCWWVPGQVGVGGLWGCALWDTCGGKPLSTNRGVQSAWGWWSPFHVPVERIQDCAVTHCHTAFRYGHIGSLPNLARDRDVQLLQLGSVLVGAWMALGWEIWGPTLPGTVTYA